MFTIDKNWSQYFLSSNNEQCIPSARYFNQIIVQQLINKVGGFKELSRFPYGFRRRNIMQLYKV